MTVYFNTQKYEDLRNFDWEKFDGSAEALNNKVNGSKDRFGNPIVSHYNLHYRISNAHDKFMESSIALFTILAITILIPVFLTIISRYTPITQSEAQTITLFKKITWGVGLAAMTPFYVAARIYECKMKSARFKLTKNELRSIKDEWRKQVACEHRIAWDLLNKDPTNTHYQTVVPRLADILRDSRGGYGTFQP